MTTEERLRLFVGFHIPRDVLEELNQALESVRGSLEGARWIPPERQHVTLKFLGAVASPLTAEIAATCRAAAEAHEPGSLRLASLGAFPSARRARVLWAGVEDPNGLTSALARDLDRSLATLGIEKEERAYTPHLTLARFKGPRDVRPGLGLDLASRWFELDEVALFQSHLGGGGPRYEVMERFDLR